MLASPVTVAILAGGESRRFGSDKAALFLPKMVKVATDAGLSVIIVGRTSHKNLPESVRFLSDTQPQQGPLGGIVTALSAGYGPIIALACDMPEVDAAALRWLVAQWLQLETTTVSGLVTYHAESTKSHNFEPLFSIYALNCLSLAQSQLAQNKRSLHGLIAQGDFSEVALPLEIAAKLTNINTPEELMIINRKSHFTSD
jgi:molybdenum cofactor guanylyltransferase